MKAIDLGIIAKWKEDTAEENALATKADLSEEGKRVYCEYYRKLNEDYYNKGLEMIQKQIKTRAGDILRGGVSQKSILSMI